MMPRKNRTLTAIVPIAFFWVHEWIDAISGGSILSWSLGFLVSVGMFS
jgi:hypothetical protein